MSYVCRALQLGRVQKVQTLGITQQIMEFPGQWNGHTDVNQVTRTCGLKVIESRPLTDTSLSFWEDISHIRVPLWGKRVSWWRP